MPVRAIWARTLLHRDGDALCHAQGVIAPEKMITLSSLIAPKLVRCPLSCACPRVSCEHLLHPSEPIVQASLCLSFT